MLQLTPNFALDEFLRSDIAARRGIRLEPSERIIDNLTVLARTVLQPLRDNVKSPIIITSGFRPVWLNTMIMGARESAHLDGRAADCRVVNMPQNEVLLRIRELALPVDQCISEFPPHGWIHVSIPPRERRARGEFLVTSVSATGRTIYQQA